jgi:hypothetical protein
MGFPLSNTFNVWVYSEFALAGLLVIGAFLNLVPRLNLARASTAVAALSTVAFMTLSCVVIFSMLSGGTYGRMKLIDMGILAGLPFILSATALSLQLKTLTKLRST